MVLHPTSVWYLILMLLNRSTCCCLYSRLQKVPLFLANPPCKSKISSEKKNYISAPRGRLVQLTPRVTSGALARHTFFFLLTFSNSRLKFKLFGVDNIVLTGIKGWAEQNHLVMILDFCMALMRDYFLTFTRFTVFRSFHLLCLASNNSLVNFGL